MSSRMSENGNAARIVRHELLGEDLRRYEQVHGEFSEKELAAARALIFDGGHRLDTQGDT